MTNGTGALVQLAAAALALLLGVALGVGATLRRQRRRDARFVATQVALERSEDRLRLAILATSEVVWDWNLVTDELFTPSWAKTYGFPEERTPATGTALFGFIHPDDAKPLGAEVHRAVEGELDRFELEHRALTGSGEWRWMLGRAHVVERGADGRATRIVGTCTDIAEQKRMRTRLEIADRMVSIGTLAAGVAHELNNPLAYVLGNVVFALDRLEALGGKPAGARSPEEALRDCAAALRDARSGAERMRDIVADMKLFSRAQEDTREPVQVAGALRAALSLSEHEIRHRARVVTEVGVTRPVLANESRLSQVFLNLLVNAAQAIPEGHADRNEIRVTVREDGRGRVEIAVRDTGSGIAPEHRKRLFDPFFTTKPLGVGTGLGLSICHGIVTALGGDIDVETEVGQGSTFRVTLPIAPESAAHATPDAPAAHRPSPGTRARVLVVDDEALFCRMMGRALSTEHDTVTLTDAREALRRLEAGERFDVVVVDLAMPVLTGMELHDEIRRLDPALAARMLFVTGGAFTPRASEFMTRFPDRVLAKPVSADTLRKRVRAALEAPRGAAPAVVR
jgi:signal transduction histidine kinase/ActR/RegA family two-component response regulator